MDRRKLKKLPSLLGRSSTSSEQSMSSVSKNITTRKPKRLSSASPESARENLTSSREGSPLVSRSSSKKRKISPSTQLTPSNITSNVTTSNRLSSILPQPQIPSDDSDEDETFITKSKELKKKKHAWSKTVTTDSPKVKEVSISRDAVEPESQRSTTPKLQTQEKRPASIKNTTKIKETSANRKSAGTNSRIELSHHNSGTRSLAAEISSPEEQVNKKQATNTRKKSLEKSNRTPKKKRQRADSFNDQELEGDSTTDDDMFGEISPKKNTANRKKQSPNKILMKSPSKQKKSPEFSRITRSQSSNRTPTKKNTVSYFPTFLKRAGIILKSDGPNLLCDSWRKIAEKLDVMINSKEHDKVTFLKEWDHFIDDIENLESMLSPTKQETEQEVFTDQKTESVARILLHVPSLQTHVSTSLLDRLAMAILAEDSGDDVPWSGVLLKQFKFLEKIVAPHILIEKLGELLESAHTYFQGEIISCLPQIVIDSQHHAVADILIKLIEDKPELTAVILDCILELTLSKDYLNRVHEKALDLLKHNPQLSAVPNITRFVLSESSAPESRIKALAALRSVDMQPLVTENIEECFSNQVLTVNALKMSCQVLKPLADSIITVIQRIKKDPKPLDLVLLLLIFSTNSSKKKNVEILLKYRVRTGFYRTSLLNTFYYDYKEVARDLQSMALPLACHLLKAGDRVYADFAIEWFRLMLLSQADAIHKQQEVLAKIIKMTSAGTDTSKNALMILSKMACKDAEREHLQKHSHHLRILLEEVDSLDLEEVATLSDLLHGLCISSNSTSDALQGDLNILLSKQLASSKPLTKCKGVLGAVMAIKHTASYAGTKKLALQLFKQVVAAVKNCSRSRSLFYDQMAEIIANTPNLDESFLTVFTDHFTAELFELYLEDIKIYRGNFTAHFNLNPESEDPEDAVYAVKFGEGISGSGVSALFKLIKACHMRSNNGELESIDILLGCPVLMMKDLHDPDAVVLDQMFNCINWFREIISGFVTQTSSDLQTTLLKRLEHLMNLQAELSMNLMMAEPHYQPPICYFHHFPSPPFVKTEKKTGKRGNKVALDKSSSLSEWASWESGSALVSKNTAYFRRLDAKIAHLLDYSMEIRLTQSKTNIITIAQVCFIIKELLAMLENEASQIFMKDLVSLLPKVCSKLEQVTIELREKDDSQNRECFRLLLCLLAAIFNWKGFHNSINNAMLRDALRTVASQTNESNTLLRSCKELVTQSCLYVELLVDIATRLPVAIALVGLFQALVQHSESHSVQHKENLAKMAYGFLCLDWPEDKSNASSYKLGIDTLLKSWLTNEPNPLGTMVTLLEWLPEEVEKLEMPKDYLARLSSITKNVFTLLFKRIFCGVIEGVKISLASAIK
ncbi:Fanconi anemia group D2 protein homolog isoform X2 [Athalia rosae]|uniref:Fanconi anemia group D2 protein homolog isoform X2 n=1 Tax=Athalia rosae TaxID=37344 RepID=UPI002034712D|nr:Fanconi anemia group D2 protein homolog isoform X2 [Athalia rosae]